MGKVELSIGDGLIEEWHYKRKKRRFNRELSTYTRHRLSTG
jgi:hypothetical protein